MTPAVLASSAQMRLRLLSPKTAETVEFELDVPLGLRPLHRHPLLNKGKGARWNHWWNQLHLSLSMICACAVQHEAQIVCADDILKSSQGRSTLTQRSKRVCDAKEKNDR